MREGYEHTGGTVAVSAHPTNAGRLVDKFGADAHLCQGCFALDICLKFKGCFCVKGAAGCKSCPRHKDAEETLLSCDFNAGGTACQHCTAYASKKERERRATKASEKTGWSSGERAVAKATGTQLQPLSQAKLTPLTLRMLPIAYARRVWYYWLKFGKVPSVQVDNGDQLFGTLATTPLRHNGVCDECCSFQYCGVGPSMDNALYRPGGQADTRETSTEYLVRAFDLIHRSAAGLLHDFRTSGGQKYEIDWAAATGSSSPWSGLTCSYS
jgi:hypothetical protein